MALPDVASSLLSLVLFLQVLQLLGSSLSHPAPCTPIGLQMALCLSGQTSAGRCGCVFGLRVGKRRFGLDHLQDFSST